MRKKISVIIPTLNEASCIETCLDNLQAIRKEGHEVIVVDGRSKDATVKLAAGKVDQIIHSDTGRAVQMNAGAKASCGDLLVFLHADSTLPENFTVLLDQAVWFDFAWGRFDVRLTGSNVLFRLLEIMMNIRSRMTGIATGDQAIFVTRPLFEKTGGFPEIALMEDIQFSAALKHYCAPICLRDKVVTSSRRWEQRGIVKTIFKMWYLRLKYFLGVNPANLAREYD